MPLPPPRGVAEKEAEDLRTLCDDLRRRQEEQAAKLPATLAFGWDYVAMVRRLAILEEHVDALLAARDLDPAAPVRFPVAGSLEAEPRARGSAELDSSSWIFCLPPFGRGPG